MFTLRGHFKMGRGEAKKEFHFNSKSTCFLCLKPAVALAVGSLSNGNCQGAAGPVPAIAAQEIQSFGPICRHLGLDMERLRVLSKRFEIRAELKVTLCKKCGGLVRWLTELIGDQEGNRKELRLALGSFGWVLSTADGDAGLARQFCRLMTTGRPKPEIPESSWEVVEAWRKDMSEKCLKLAAEKDQPNPVGPQLSPMVLEWLCNRD